MGAQARRIPGDRGAARVGEAPLEPQQGGRVRHAPAEARERAVELLHLGIGEPAARERPAAAREHDRGDGGRDRPDPEQGQPDRPPGPATIVDRAQGAALQRPLEAARAPSPCSGTDPRPRKNVPSWAFSVCEAAGAAAGVGSNVTQPMPRK